MCFKYLNIVQFILLHSLIFNPFSTCSSSAQYKSGSGYSGRLYIPNLLLLNFDYLSDAQYQGLTSPSLNQPMLSSGVSFYSAKKYDVSVQAIFAGNSDSSFTKAACEYDFTARYTFHLSPKLTLSPSYTHIAYSRNSNSLLTAYSEIIQTDMFFISENYLAGGSFNYLAGRKDMFFLNFQNAFYINFNKFPGKKTLLSLQFEIDITINDKNYYNSLMYDGWDVEEFTSWVYEKFPEYSQTMENEIRLAGLETAKDRLAGYLENDDYNLFDPSYSLTSVQLLTPIMFSMSRFTLSLIPLISIPCYRSEFYDPYTSFMMNAGLSISFNP